MRCGAAREPLLDRGVWERALQVAAGGDFVRHIVGFDPAQDGRFESAEAEVERIAFHFGEGEADGGGIAVGRQAVDDGAAGIAEAEQFGHLVESFAGGVVARLAEQAVVEALADLEEVGVAAADHQGEGGKSHRRSGASGFQDDGVNVAFDVIDRDQRNANARS